MATELGKVVTHHEELPLKKLLDPLITRFCEITWHVKYFYLHVHLTNRHQIWQGGD